MPVRFVLGFEMRNFQPCTGFACYLQSLLYSLFDTVVLVSHVYGKESVVFCHNLAELYNLFIAGIGTGGIFQTAGEAEASHLHLLVQNCAHLCNVFFGGLDVLVSHDC